MTKHPVLDPGITVTMLRHMQSVQNFLGKKETAHLSDKHILLTGEGRRQGRITAKLLEEEYVRKGVREVQVLVSPAKRTTDTGEMIVEAAAHSELLDYKVRILDDLKETCMVPRELQDMAALHMPDRGLFGRHLMESGHLPSLDEQAVLDGLVPVRRLQDRLDRITTEINTISRETGVCDFLIISHQFTNRLIAANQWLRIPLQKVDSFEKFPNEDVWRFDGNVLEAVHPKPRRIGSVQDGYSHPNHKFVPKAPAPASLRPFA